MAKTAAASPSPAAPGHAPADPPFRGRRLRRGLPALASVLALVFAVAAGPAQADAGPGAGQAAPSLPAVIPSIDGWEPGDGVFSAAEDLRIVPEDPELERTAEISATELATAIPGASTSLDETRPGDVGLALDPSREDLGDEGYELSVGEEITVTAATGVGVFYGTRTVLQMLTQQTEIPYGDLVDVPDYAERGVTVCACVINISPEWIDRLLEEMSYLKMNTVVMEMKLKVDGYPQTNTWSYYTKEDVAAFVAKAEERGIDVIPEINSPGHMEIWLENLPELQLTNPATGEKDEVRMDITKEESFEFYTALMDEYDDVFTSDYWHMGVDEYMLGSGYDNFPQVLEFAHEKFGEDATENDVVAWYVNRVNQHAQESGKTLRIWNDGVITDNEVVDFDTDIIVEHWNNAASEVSPQTFVDWGHDVVNVSNSLYMVRGGYGVDSRSLYESDWTPSTFFDGEVTTGTEQIRGARMSIWPDGGTPQEAENTTEERMVEPLRLVAQATWAASAPWDGYDEFRSAMDSVGRSPLAGTVDRLPVDDGAYRITDPANGQGLIAGEDGSVELGQSGDPLTMAATDDGYYTIRSADGRCLDLSREGTIRLEVPVQIGADARLAECTGTTLQKWQVRDAEGGYVLSNAASQQRLVVSDGLTDVPISGEGMGSVPDGRVVQTPPDLGDTAWALTGLEPSVHAPVRAVPRNEVLEVTAAGFAPGEDVHVSLTRRGGDTIEAGTVSANEDGAFSGELEIPDGLSAGPYTLTLTGAVSKASAEDRVILAAG